MKPIALLIVLSLLLSSSCAFLGDTVAVDVRLPRRPFGAAGSWNGYRWVVEYPHPGGGRTACTVPGDREDIEIRLPRGVNVPVTAALVPPDGCAACPAPLMAGAIFPLHSTEPLSMSLTWEDGPAAAVILALFETAWVVETINTERFCSEVLEVSGGDPWILDMERARYALLYGGMNVHALKELPSYEPTIDLSLGTWVFDDTLRPPLLVDREGETNVSFREGFHGMTRISEAVGFDDRITVAVDGAGYVAAYPVRGYVSTENW